MGDRSRPGVLRRAGRQTTASMAGALGYLPALPCRSDSDQHQNHEPRRLPSCPQCSRLWRGSKLHLHLTTSGEGQQSNFSSRSGTDRNHVSGDDRHVTLIACQGLHPTAPLETGDGPRVGASSSC